MEKEDQIKRGQRLKSIRENELHLNKSDLAKKLNISSQFLGLVEKGQCNLNYNSIKLLRDLSGHSADYILYGLDDSIIRETRQFLKYYSDRELVDALKLLREISLFVKSNY